MLFRSVLTLFFAFGVAFEIPVATVLLIWIGVVDVGLRRPNLDDVFLSLTGQTTGEPETAEEDK